MSRTSDCYPMSNLSDSEFLLNHSAIINLEGDHRSMLLLGPETYRGPVNSVNFEKAKRLEKKTPLGSKNEILESLLMGR